MPTKENAAGEPLVTHKTAMPQGYHFVPKGNVYMTKNCRKETQEAGKTVYVVVENPSATRIKTLGIRVPADVHRRVAEAERQTRAQRAAKVQKRDDAGLHAFELAVERLFPHAPADAVAKIAQHALVKRSRRVGRSGTMEMDKKVRLAVTAHIRHTHTDYDALLRQGVPRDDARAQVWRRIADKAKEWTGRPGKQPGNGDARRGKKQTQRQKDRAASRNKGGKKSARKQPCAAKTPAVEIAMSRKTVKPLPNSRNAVVVGGRNNDDDDADDVVDDSKEQSHADQQLGTEENPLQISDSDDPSYSNDDDDDDDEENNDFEHETDPDCSDIDPLFEEDQDSDFEDDMDLDD